MTGTRTTISEEMTHTRRTLDAIKVHFGRFCADFGVFFARLKTVVRGQRSEIRKGKSRDRGGFGVLEVRFTSWGAGAQDHL
jgi:hypothetical protein